METATPIVLQSQNLSVGYTSRTKQQAIVSEISIDLKKGELVGLIGINGSGKSTLLRTLAALQQPLDGEIRITGNLLTAIKQEELAKQLSVVLTNQAISKNLSVLELVSLGRQPYANWLGSITQKDEQHIQEALIATASWELRDKKCFELSDGQLQRALIARALAQDTAIILLDEPLSHLDLHHKAAILKLLKTITQSHDKTILFSSHDIEHMLPLCDTILLLKEGLCTSGTPQELIENKSLHTLFPSEHIRFDATTARFSIDK